MKCFFTSLQSSTPANPGGALPCGVGVMSAAGAAASPSVQQDSGSMYSSTGSTTTTSSTSGLMSMVLPSDELVSSSCTCTHRTQH